MSNVFRFVAMLCVLSLAGCSGYEPSRPPPAKTKPAAPAAAQPPGTQPELPPPQSASGSAARSGPASAPSQPPLPSASPSAAAPLPVQLSAGTALAQTLPDGTAMGFSVDYQFTQGQPEPSAQYFWVIERAQGSPTKQAVRLQARGTLQGFVTHFRPEHGPFQAYLEDARGNRLSPTVPLR